MKVCFSSEVPMNLLIGEAFEPTLLHNFSIFNSMPWACVHNSANQGLAQQKYIVPWLWLLDRRSCSRSLLDL